MGFKTWAAIKDPNDIADYGIDWSADLGVKTIVGSTWTVAEGTVTVSTSSSTTTKTTVRLAGGLAGETAILRNHVTLSDGEEFDRSVKLKVAEQ